MGTRSLTALTDTWREKEGAPFEAREICRMYRQFDGYPDGHGADLVGFLRGTVVGNGLHGNDPAKYANGMSELAAKIITHFKQKYPSGNIYLHPPGTKDCWEEYLYTVYLKVEDDATADATSRIIGADKIGTLCLRIEEVHHNEPNGLLYDGSVDSDELAKLVELEKDETEDAKAE